MNTPEPFILPVFSHRARRRNGRRSFTIDPTRIIAWNGGYTPITETESLVALGWIFRHLAQWKTKANVYDMMHVGSGQRHRSIPAVVMDGASAFSQLRELLSRLAEPTRYPSFAKFARQKLGFKSLNRTLWVQARKPSSNVFSWLGSLHGCRLQASPNKSHPNAFWLHGAALYLVETTGRWNLRITHSYRQEDSTWAIGLDQKPDEKLEDFDARAWLWLRDQIAWRHDERFYHRFFVPSDGMKKNELLSCAGVERQMFGMQKSLRNVFSWGCGAPGFWEQGVTESLVRDASPQFRELKKIGMTGGRLRTLGRWIEQDRKAAAAKLAAKAAA